MTDLYWDPFTPELRDDPYPLWTRLRDEAPAWYNERLDFWAITRFHDIEVAFKDWETFSSAHGTVLELMTDEPYPDGRLIFSSTRPTTPAFARSSSRAFTPRRVNELEARIHELCADFLDRHVGSGGFDFVQDFAAPLPPTSSRRCSAYPIAEQDDVRHLIDTMFTIEPGVGTMNRLRSRRQHSSTTYFARQLLERRRDDPRTTC